MSSLAKTSAEMTHSSFEYDTEQLRLIKDTLMPKGASDDELQLFINVCKLRKLDPFSKQIYAMERWTDGQRKVTYQTSIDGFRSLAARTGQYEGQAPVQWCGKDGKWQDVWLSSEPPVAARAGVYRSGFREPLFAVARFDAYVQTKRDGKLNSMWLKMPDGQIAKCAESLALRKAFPEVLSGIYTDDEMSQSDNEHRPLRSITPTKTGIASQPTRIIEDAEIVQQVVREASVKADLLSRFEKFVKWYEPHGFSREDLYEVIDCNDESKLTEDHMTKLRDNATAIKEQKEAEEKFKLDKATKITESIMRENSDDDVKF